MVIFSFSSFGCFVYHPREVLVDTVRSEMSEYQLYLNIESSISTSFVLWNRRTGWCIIYFLNSVRQLDSWNQFFHVLDYREVKTWRVCSYMYIIFVNSSIGFLCCELKLYLCYYFWFSLVTLGLYRQALMPYHTGEG